MPVGGIGKMTKNEGIPGGSEWRGMALPMRGSKTRHVMRGWPRRQDVENGLPLRCRIAQKLNVSKSYALLFRSFRPCGPTILNILAADKGGAGYLIGFEVDLLPT